MGTAASEPKTLIDRLRDLLAQEHDGMAGEFGACDGAPKCDTCEVLQDAEKDKRSWPVLECPDCDGAGHRGEAPDGRKVSCETCGGDEDSLGRGWVKMSDAGALDTAEKRADDGERFRSFLIDIARKMDLLGTTIADLPAAVAFERTEMIEIVAEQYLDALHAGQKPDRDQIVGRSPVTISEDLRKRLALVELLQKGAEKPSRPEIICLCGSSRFVQEMAAIAWGFEKDGKITMGLHLLPEGYGAPADHLAEAEGVAEQMDELHLRKIDLADRVFVVNIGGYIGDSTRREIGYATAAGKPVAYLEPEPCPVEDCDEPPEHV